MLFKVSSTISAQIVLKYIKGSIIIFLFIYLSILDGAIREIPNKY